MARYGNRKLEWKRSEKESFTPTKLKAIGIIASTYDRIQQLISINVTQAEHGRLKPETKQIEAETVTSLIRRTVAIR